MVGVGFGLLDVGVLCGEPAAANDDHELNSNRQTQAINKYVCRFPFELISHTWQYSSSLDPYSC